jgi:hypothetical protein
MSGGLRLIPREHIREASVFGLTPGNYAAPPMPEIPRRERSIFNGTVLV